MIPISEGKADEENIYSPKHSQLFKDPIFNWAICRRRSFTLNVLAPSSPSRLGVAIWPRAVQIDS